ncbi:glucosamine-6-phosphate deaminase [Cytobacillus eiseniae]|uniref:Glucosamine-6-phosphate deaminase n=1 Tax=Cytobacillus eiseniae TaxID=762947 RepID=A0ABS4RGZ0_9BACI|nr:glucosamine-6-phosphate deaminase [Cytobacillus eiseniae]MBP2242158.1 glucosamine-6-phosphate deaminase [Cytobacillus eiseniae]
MNIKLERFNDQEALYNRAFEIIGQHLNAGAKSFGLATGGTMVPLYSRICQSDLDFSQCTSVNLDEYVGLPRQHDESYYAFMQNNLFQTKPFKETNLPNGEAQNVEEEASQYEQLVQSKNVDLQLLGVGENGHIGFNEPGTPFTSETHVVQLTPSTREANARFFDSIDEVPEKAITLGISTILRAKCILLLAVGEKKRAALDALLSGEITEKFPITSLRTHSNVIVLTDL